jgi:hypothetical protein
MIFEAVSDHQPYQSFDDDDDDYDDDDDDDENSFRAFVHRCC